MVRAGLASHYCPKDKLEDLQAALLSLPPSLSNDHVRGVLDSFSTADKDFSLTPHLKDISECFTAPTLNDVITNLREVCRLFAILVIEI